MSEVPLQSDNTSRIVCHHSDTSSDAPTTSDLSNAHLSRRVKHKLLLHFHAKNRRPFHEKTEGAMGGQGAMQSWKRGGEKSIS